LHSQPERFVVFVKPVGRQTNESLLRPLTSYESPIFQWRREKDDGAKLRADSYKRLVVTELKIAVVERLMLVSVAVLPGQLKGWRMLAFRVCVHQPDEGLLWIDVVDGRSEEDALAKGTFSWAPVRIVILADKIISRRWFH
jgi:hypothetical protein